jgi:undecaprenyl-diphosphatase
VALLVVAFERLVHVLPVKGGTRIDDAVAHALLSIQDDAGIMVFTWISWMGDTALAGMLLVAVVILAHRRRWAAAVTAVIASLGGMMIDASLKSVFHRARPDYAVELITGPTWSFPSGHAMASIVGFGVLAYFRRELEDSSSAAYG